MSGAQSLVDSTDVDWPARAYVYGTWAYALSQARARAEKHRQRLWLYGSTLDGEPTKTQIREHEARVAEPLSVASASVRDTNLGSSE